MLRALVYYFISLWLVSLKPSLAQNTTPHKEDFFKPRQLGTLALGDRLFIDTSRAIDVKFAGTGNQTFLFPSFNSSGLQVHSQPSALSISLPEHHRCHKILYLDEEFCALRCSDATILVALAARRVVGSVDFACFLALPDWISTKVQSVHKTDVFGVLICDRGSKDPTKYQVVELVKIPAA